VGPVEDSTRPDEDREHSGRKGPTRRPRTRGCLLKGCGQRFRPVEARQRDCSQQCRQAARQWSRWKAQEKYRGTPAGKQKRNGQSRRYRERVRNRKPPRSEAVPEAARVITKNFFSIISVTGRAATRGSCSAGDHPASGSARRSADTHGSASGSVSGAGRRRGPDKKRKKGHSAWRGIEAIVGWSQFDREIVPTY
jgi:hypothetical protein